MSLLYYFNEAFKKFKSNFGKSVLVMGFYNLINYFLSLIFGISLLTFISKIVFIEAINTFLQQPFIASFLALDSVIVLTVIFLLLIILTLIEYGYNYFFLKIAKDDENIDVTDIFFGFKHIFKFIGLTIIKSILISFGTILFVLPGLIFSLMYSMASFIIVEDENKGVIQSLKESRLLMKGNKMYLFFIMLIITIGISAINSLISGFVISITLFSILYIVCSSILNGYATLVYALFYKSLKDPIPSENFESNVVNEE